jgi:hypothetical protein
MKAASLCFATAADALQSLYAASFTNSFMAKLLLQYGQG